MMVAYIVLPGLRRMALLTGVSRLVWHPALQVATYLIVLSPIVLLATQVGLPALMP